MPKQSPKGSHRRRKQRARTARRKKVHRGTTIVASGPPHDDCPVCRAMAAAGVVQDADGVARLSAAQHKRYEAEFDRIFAADAVAEGDKTGEPMMEAFHAVNEVWVAEGRSLEPMAMDDQGLAEHMKRVYEIANQLGFSAHLAGAA